MNDFPTAVPSHGSDDWHTPEYVPTYAAWPVRRFQHRWWLHITLFLATFVTTTLFGIAHYAGFISDFGTRPVALSRALVPEGLWYSLTILAILGAHEMGHYLACRYHQVDATLPFFIPMPIIETGTLGAVIKIREPFPNRRVLFDVGVAGPLAGFAVLVPTLLIGLALSNLVPLPANFSGYELGEPLLFKAATRLVWGAIPDGLSLNMHPMAYAAWFGILATALNLMPFGQLDGGHIAYSALGDRSTRISLITVLCTVVLAFYAVSWVLWSVLMVAMMFFFGPHHPRPIDDSLQLGFGRRIIALAAGIIFVICFMPVPMQLLKF